MERREAKANGLKRYFTGRPCSRGHIVERATASGRCVKCNKVICSEWASENQKWLNTYHVEWYHRDPDDRRRKINKRRENPEVRKKHNETNAEWRASRPDYMSEWKTNNPEKHKANDLNYLSRKKGAEGRHTGEDIERIYEEQSGRCVYCNKKLGRKYQVDHIMPLARGGTNWPDNIQLLCRKTKGACNQRKHARDPVEFARSLGLIR